MEGEVASAGYPTTDLEPQNSDQNTRSDAQEQPTLQNVSGSATETELSLLRCTLRNDVSHSGGSHDGQNEKIHVAAAQVVRRKVFSQYIQKKD